MSLLIKGMEMPKHSGKNNIPDLHKACIKVYANGKCDLVLMEGKEHYPLVEVPTSHGDLIDREKVKELLLDLWKAGKDYSIADIIREIVDIPTIIEAEE